MTETPVPCPTCTRDAKVITQKLTNKPAQPVLVCVCGTTIYDRTLIYQLVTEAREAAEL